MKRKLLTLPLATILAVSAPLVSMISCGGHEEDDPTIEDITIDESEKQQSADFQSGKAVYTFSFSGEDDTAIQLEIVESTNGSIKFDTGYDNVTVKDGKFTTVIMFDEKPESTLDCPFSLKCKYKINDEAKEQSINDLHIWYVKQIEIDNRTASFIDDVATFNFYWFGDTPTTITPELVLTTPTSGLILETSTIETTGNKFIVKVRRTDQGISVFKFNLNFAYEIVGVGTFNETEMNLTTKEASDPTIEFDGEVAQTGVTRDLGTGLGWQSAATYAGFTATNIDDIESDLVVETTERVDGSGETHLGKIYPYVYETSINAFELVIFIENWNVVAGTYSMDVKINHAKSGETLWETDGATPFTMTFAMNIIEPAADQRTASSRSHLDEYTARFTGFQFLHVDLSYDDKVNRLVTLYDVDDNKDLKDVYSDYSIDFSYDSIAGENPNVTLEIYFGFQQIKKLEINCKLTFTYHGTPVIDGSTGYKITKGI